MALFVVAILTVLGIISFEGTTILEAITTNVEVDGITGSLPSVGFDWKYS